MSFPRPAGCRPPQCQNRRCRRFKSRPSSVCGTCGHDPVTYNGCPHEFDRAHGFD